MLWSTAPDRFWVATSLNHLASSFQDIIHILCKRISLLLHATVMALQFGPPSNETFFCTFYARYILEGTPSFKARSKNWLPKRRLKSRLPRRTAARRTPALEGVLFHCCRWMKLNSLNLNSVEIWRLPLTHLPIFFPLRLGWSCSTLPKLYGTAQWKRLVTFHECFLSSLWVCS